MTAPRKPEPNPAGRKTRTLPGGYTVTGGASWSAAASLRRALAALDAPPTREHIERPEPKGELVARFVLPLELCPTLNVLAEWPGWRRKKVKDAALKLMHVQNGLRRLAQPLAGRPRVRCTRFSSVEPDRDSAWTKVPLDRLTGRKGGLGFLRDDRPSACDVVAWWEPAKRGEGCVLVEVYADPAVGVGEARSVREAVGVGRGWGENGARR